MNIIPDLTIEHIKDLAKNGILVCETEPSNEKLQYIKSIFEHQLALTTSQSEVFDIMRKKLNMSSND